MENRIDLSIGIKDSSFFVEYLVTQDDKQADRKRIEFTPSDVGGVIISIAILMLLTRNKSDKKLSTLMQKFYEHRKKPL
jgi:hypothetical protein